MAKMQKKKPKLILDVTSQEFAELGAGIMNRFPGGSGKNRGGDFDTQWHAHFYIEPEVCAYVTYLQHNIKQGGQGQNSYILFVSETIAHGMQ